MSVWETFVNQSKDLVTTASGAALEKYGQKIAADAAPAPAKTIEPKKRNWPLIGGIAAVVIGLVIWLATRKSK